MDQVKELVLGNRIITICEAANMLGISFRSVQRENNLRNGISGLVSPS
jgi:hypothetical protein